MDPEDGKICLLTDPDVPLCTPGTNNWTTETQLCQFILKIAVGKTTIRRVRGAQPRAKACLGGRVRRWRCKVQYSALSEIAPRQVDL